MIKPTEEHRLLYRHIVGSTYGLTGDELDRVAPGWRRIWWDVTYLAATNPDASGHVHVLGFDPHTRRWVAAVSREQAERVLDFAHDEAVSQQQAVKALDEAIDAAHPPDHTKDQGRLFE